MKPARNTYSELRRQDLLNRIILDGQATVFELSRDFAVSEVTIRGDLHALANQNLVIRTHGGAIATNRIPELSLWIRQQRQVQEKDRIGAFAAHMIHVGDAVFLDTSSTALAIARHLKNQREITIITNSLAVAQVLADNPGINTVMPGGTLQRDTLSLIGTEGLLILNRYNIQYGFFGAHGISDPEGLTDVSVAEAEVKQQVVSQCRQVIAILDGTKWGRVGAASFAPLQKVHSIITDQPGPENLVKTIQEYGVQIHIV